MDIYSAVTHLYNAIPTELRAVIYQKLVDWGVHAFEEAQSTAQEINEQEALYKWYLKEFVEHFSAIEVLDQLVPFTGSLGVDRFLLWPELDKETRGSADKPNDAEQDRKPPLPRKLKATQLLTHPLSNKRLFAVEGAAGVGKTTMARALARFAATQTLELMERENEGGSQVQYLPLYFNAEDLIKLAKSGQEDQDGPNGEGALKDLLGGVLQKPNRALLVIVDGLDEVEGPIRTKALIALLGLWLPGGNHRYLLLGRPGSIRNVTWVREEEAALKLSLKPWGKEEVREYLGRWTEEGGRPHLEAAGLDQLVEYMRSRVGLPSPALLVQMVVASYVELKRDGLENPLEQIPATRTELYRNYLRLLLERSEGDKALQGAGSTAHPANLERRKWLGCLELLLRLFPEQRERARAQKCSANHLPDVAAARARGRSCGKLLREEANFTKWWEDRKLCRLGHESLHEFLAAEALARLYQGDPKGFWKDWLHPSIFDPYWQQTLIFAMALMDEEDQSALMRGLLALGSCDPISKHTKRHLEVMAKSWGAGVRYDQAIWEEWLDSEPHSDLLVAAAANANLRIRAQEALDRLAQEGEDEEMRLRAAEALMEINPDLATPVLEWLARGAKSRHVRLNAAKGLVGLKPETAVSALEKLVQEREHEWVRIDATRALGELGPRTLPTLKQLARKGSKRVRATAAAMLLQHCPDTAVPILEQLARNGESGAEQLRAARALMESNNELAVATLERLAQQGNELVQLETAIVLRELNTKLAVLVLERLAHEGVREGIRFVAASMLGSLGSEAAPILERLAHGMIDEDVQIVAAEALSELNPKLAMSTLERLAAKGKGEEVQLGAAEALVGLNSELAAPFLEQLAREGEVEWVQLGAAEALVGLNSELAMLILYRLAGEGKDKEVRWAAADTLRELGIPPIGCKKLKQGPN